MEGSGCGPTSLPLYILYVWCNAETHDNYSQVNAVGAVDLCICRECNYLLGVNFRLTLMWYSAYAGGLRKITVPSLRKNIFR